MVILLKFCLLDAAISPLLLSQPSLLALSLGLVEMEMEVCRGENAYRAWLHVGILQISSSFA